MAGSVYPEEHQMTTPITQRWTRRELGILKELQTHLDTVQEYHLDPRQLNEAASMIAGLCLTLSKYLETRAERKQSQQLAQLMNESQDSPMAPM